MSYAVAGYFVEKIGRRARSSFTWPPICADAFRRPEGFCNALKMMLESLFMPVAEPTPYCLFLFI